MLKKLKKKLRLRKNSKENLIESQKEELLKCYKKIHEKDQMILSLFEVRDDLKQKINELLEELEDLRRSKK